ncbi:MAG TPA: molybdopterin-dependent oxidoreductase [Candidatus Dormibacteraeota bacterium]|nr:molybdopterin-dependent oxidoreductase [Candidatus Dormibacteraeota bacterium]
MTRKQAFWHGFGWGCVGGLAFVALMYVANIFLGLRPLPQLLNEPLLSLMPGPIFGFLIDTLQHAGKVVEELGLIVAIVVALGVLGGLASIASLRGASSRIWTSEYLPFAFAAIGWVVTVAILLPIGGAGLLGLNDGFATPLIWAVLFAVYAVVLQFGAQPAPGVDAGRRRLLTRLPLSIAGLSVLALAYRLGPDWYSAVFSAAGSGLHGISPALTPVDDFYVVSKNFADPVVDGSTWKLHIGGMADKPLTLSLSDLRALPPTTEYVTLECVSNDVGGPQISTGSFTGVSLASLIDMAAPQTQATWVAFSARDGYTESFDLGMVRATPEILVAYDLNGAPLPSQHGYPARILIPGHYGMKGPKWLDSITLTNQESRGYWEQQGWDRNAVVKTTSRIDVPQDGEIVKLGPLEVGGVAFAGTRGISKVEFSTDGGSSWSEAPFDPPLSKLTWVVWRTTWTPAAEGAYRLAVRATDGSGVLQPNGSAPSYPDGSSGYHSVQVNVSK